MPGFELGPLGTPIGLGGFSSPPPVSTPAHPVIHPIIVSPSQPPVVPHSASEDEVSSSEEAKSSIAVCSSESMCIPKNGESEEIPSSFWNSNLGFGFGLGLESVYESAARLLFLAVKWARTVPSFLQVS